MFYSDDPILDYERHCKAQENALARLPECSRCGEYIQDEYAYYINDEWVCEECIDEFKRYVDVEY